MGAVHEPFPTALFSFPFPPLPARSYPTCWSTLWRISSICIRRASFAAAVVEIQVTYIKVCAVRVER